MWRLLGELVATAALAALLMLACDRLYADEYRLLEPRAVTVRGDKIETLRDPYLRDQDDRWEYKAYLGLELDLLSGDDWRLYYDPTLSFTATDSQIREGSLTYYLGGQLDIGNREVSVFKYHVSRHALEGGATTPDGGSTSRHYPINDSYGMQIRWRLP